MSGTAEASGHFRFRPMVTTAINHGELVAKADRLAGIMTLAQACLIARSHQLTGGGRIKFGNTELSAVVYHDGSARTNGGDCYWPIGRP
jgi:hypothetical protein